MQILINGRLAALKQGTSFEYVSENRLFSGSDGYTLTITFPLRGCPQNLAIFGHIHRSDVEASKVVFDCEIQDKAFYRTGCITLTEISETEVKTQFLDGRSEQNFSSTLDKVYINELPLGIQGAYQCRWFSPAEKWAVGDMTTVALPWVSPNGNIQNRATYNNSTHEYSWHSDTIFLSCQPYLMHLTRRICVAIGYDCDLSEWEARDDLKFLVCCNSLPGVWAFATYTRCLPHWTVEEYFSNLELFLGCEFDLDHRSRRVECRLTDSILQTKSVVTLHDVIEEHSTEVKVEETKCEYLEAKNLVYKDCDHATWKYYSCDWYMRSLPASSIVEYDTIAELISESRAYEEWNGENPQGSLMSAVLYARDEDMYFVIRALTRRKVGNEYKYTCRLQPINTFGGRIVDTSDEADEVELDFVPVRIDETDAENGRCMFLTYNGYDEEEYDYDPDAFRNSTAIKEIEAGEKDKSAEYYDRIYVGWWDGNIQQRGLHPYPNVYDCEVVYVSLGSLGTYATEQRHNFSLRLNNRTRSRGAARAIEPSKKATFKFLSDSIPDVRALFIIAGKRYICEKITATFTEEGMSQLLKGVFYLVAQD